MGKKNEIRLHFFLFCNLKTKFFVKIFLKFEKENEF